MENFDDIKSIWQSEKAGQLPDADEFVTIVNKYKSRRHRITYVLSGILILCLAGFVLVWFGYKTTMWTTRLGELLIFTAVLYAIYHNYKDIQKKKKENAEDSRQFLASLKKEVTEKKEEKKRILIFLSLLCIAYGFFIYENASGSLQSILITYLLLLAVIFFFWFVYRPFVNRMQQKSTEKMIQKIEELQKQLV